MFRCRGSASLVLLLALAAFITIIFIRFVEKSGEDDEKAFWENFEMMHQPAPFLGNPNILFDLHNFYYLIEPPPCSPEEKILAVLLITSHFEHVELRSSIRRGYPADVLASLGIKRVFLLAKTAPVSDEVLKSEESHWRQGSIIDEASRFNDILQGHFVESYKNLTYKNTMGLLWAARKCSQSKFIAKMDDDIAVNLFEVAKVMRAQVGKPYRLSGNVIAGGRPQRDPDGKWYMTQKDFAEDVFPTYLSGWLYFGPTPLLGRLAHRASKMPYLFVDDVLLTGIARKELLGDKNVFFELNSRFAKDAITVRCCLLKSDTACHLVAGPVHADSYLMLRFLNRARKCDVRGACLPAPEELRGCGTDVRALIEDAIAHAATDDASIGVASPVPL